MIEFITANIGLWIDLIEDNLPPLSCILSMTDSTTTKIDSPSYMSKQSTYGSRPLGFCKTAIHKTWTWHCAVGGKPSSVIGARMVTDLPEFSRNDVAFASRGGAA